ncbi:MAG TPA: FecR domain-containing protein [Opitutaceae bacterium]|nr:FecR domain-containing protein [Opitutaceae bacterium]
MKRREKDRTIAAAAGDWFLRRAAGLTDEEQAQFDAWCSANPNHSAALDKFARTWATLNEPRERGMADHALKALGQRRVQRARQRRKVSLWTAGLAAAALIAFAVVPLGRPNRVEKGARSSIAIRPDRQTLPDGSSVELNAGAHFELYFTAAERRVHLVRGEALFLVQKDSARPFVVSAGAIAVRAVGTAFAVRYDASGVDVLVTEGKVAVEPRATGPGRSEAATFVSAGGRLIIPADAVGQGLRPAVTVGAAEIARSLAWRGRRIEFSETPLAAVLNLFNQKNALQLEAEDVATGQREVSGVFWADDAETFVRLVETGLDLRAERTGNRVVLRQK